MNTLKQTTNILLVIFIALLFVNAIMLFLKVDPQHATLGIPNMMRIGERAESSNIALTAHSVRLDTAGAGPLTPPTGMKFVVVDLSVENLSTSSLPIIPLLNFYLKDTDGRVYRNTAVPSPYEMLSGDILPHDRLREEIGFAVPITQTAWTLYYEPGMKDTKTFVIQITEMPPTP